MQLKFPRSYSHAFSTLATLLALVVATAAPAQTPRSDEVLAKNADTTMTRLDWEADLTRIPAPNRIGFASDPRRVQATVNNILVGKTFAARARAAGLDKDPVVQRRIELEADRVLLQLWLDKLEADAGAEFDRKGDASLPRARELYLLDKAKYDIAESVEAWHVLFTPAKHGGSDGALAAAKDARAKLATGADFATLAKEISDDPSAKNNGGHLPNVLHMRKQLAIPFLALLVPALPACQGPETTRRSEALVCSGADVPVYSNRFAPQSGASGVATAPEAAAGIVSSDAPTGATPTTALGPALAAVPAGAGSTPPADTAPVPVAADAGTGGDPGGGDITAMIATCGPSPCSPGQVAVQPPPTVAATAATPGGLAPSSAAPVDVPASAVPATTPPPAPATTLVCAPPPPNCPEGQSPQFTMKQTWECTDCSLVVTYGALYGNYRRCVNMPHIQCPDGEVPTWVFEHEQWECKTKCDNGQYDQHVAQGLLVCVPC